MFNAEIKMTVKVRAEDIEDVKTDLSEWWAQSGIGMGQITITNRRLNPDEFQEDGCDEELFADTTYPEPLASYEKERADRNEEAGE